MRTVPMTAISQREPFFSIDAIGLPLSPCGVQRNSVRELRYQIRASKSIETSPGRSASSLRQSAQNERGKSKPSTEPDQHNSTESLDSREHALGHAALPEAQYNGNRGKPAE